jgi:hypothetical protein
MKAYEGEELQFHSFLTLALEWSFTLRPVFAEYSAPSISWIGGWTGPRAGLNTLEKRKSFACVGNRSTIPTELSQLWPRVKCPVIRRFVGCIPTSISQNGTTFTELSTMHSIVQSSTVFPPPPPRLVYVEESMQYLFYPEDPLSTKTFKGKKIDSGNPNSLLLNYCQENV